MGTSSTRRRVLRIAVVAALAVTQSARATPAEDTKRRPTTDEIRQLLEAGDTAGAHATATLAAEYAPDNPETLALASVAAEAAGDRDSALTLAKRAAQAAATAGLSRAKVKPLTERVAELDPIESDVRSRLDAAQDGYLELGRLAAKRKLWANAVGLLSRCVGTPQEGAAVKDLAGVYGKKAAVEALLHSGLDVPVQRASTRPTSWIATNDAKHREWEDAWEIKTANYTVVTNVGWEVANAMAEAMEQMNEFYRDVFRHKQRGGGTARCTIYAYKDKEEFLAHVDEDQHDSAGFFSPGENTVNLFDPRPRGDPISELWRTLYHEASHQFTDMIMADMAPIWLDEGTASYFEGAQIQPNGQVRTNLVVGDYLARLVDSIGSGAPSLRTVVSYDLDESYPADYYPLGWGLVYFLRNYEDDALERVYSPRYDAYVDAYRTGGKHDKFERFVQYFITDAKQPGIESFADFQERFETYFRELNRLWTGGAEVAPDLLDLARRRRAAKQPSRAVDACRWALEKDPRNVAVAFELADLLRELGNKDAAIATYRRVVELARSGDLERGVTGLDVKGMDETTAGDAAQHALAAIAKLDSLFAERCETVAAELDAAARAVATAYLEAGLPDNAARALAVAAGALGSPRDLREELDRVVRNENGHWRRRCRMPVSPGLDAWRPIGPWTTVDGAMSISTDGVGLMEYSEDLPDAYRFEVTVRATRFRETGWAAIAFGIGSDGVWDALGVYVNGTVTVERCGKKFTVLLRLPDITAETLKEVALAVDVDGDVATFFVEGKQVGNLALGAAALRGRLGVACSSGDVTFHDPVLIVR